MMATFPDYDTNILMQKCRKGFIITIRDGITHNDIAVTKKELEDIVKLGAHMLEKPKKKEAQKEWKILPQYGRDMHSDRFVEAICPHGIGHHKGVHGCDGCCQNAPKDIWKQVSKD